MSITYNTNFDIYSFIWIFATRKFAALETIKPNDEISS